MANLDTRSKRASSVQIIASYILSVVLPDGTISQGDRQHIPWTYSGILAVTSIISICRIVIVDAENRSVTPRAENRTTIIDLENRTVIIPCSS